MGVSDIDMIQPGDTFTVAGIYERVPNSSRWWFQFWKPRTIAGPNLMQFTVKST